MRAAAAAAAAWPSRARRASSDPYAARRRDEILLMLLGAMTIDCGDGGDHAIRAADFLQIGHVEEQPHVAGAPSL